jgi:hypothetical protein
MRQAQLWTSADLFRQERGIEREKLFKFRSIAKKATVITNASRTNSYRAGVVFGFFNIWRAKQYY